MTSEWELTADTLKLAYADGISVNPHEDQADQYECGVCMEAHALVDRFIARIKAEAWDEGYAAGQADDERSDQPIPRGGVAVNWGEQSDRAAIRYYSDWCPDGIQEAHRRGARWQREALLSDESVDRVARELYEADVAESMDTPWPDYDSPKNVGRPLYEERARNALTAAIGGRER